MGGLITNLYQEAKRRLISFAIYSSLTKQALPWKLLYMNDKGQGISLAFVVMISADYIRCFR